MAKTTILPRDSFGFSDVEKADLGPAAYYDVIRARMVFGYAAMRHVTGICDSHVGTAAREPTIKSKGCPNCAAPWQPVCSYCKTVNE